MLESIFAKLLILSVQAGFLILATILIRTLFKKIPKRVICLLWCMATLRLLIPVTIESSFSLVPGEHTIQGVFAEETANDYGNLRTEQMVQAILPEEDGQSVAVENIVVGTGIAYVENMMTGKVAGTDVNEDAAYTNVPVQEEDLGTTYVPATEKKAPDLRALVIFLWLFGTALLLAYGAFTYIRVRLKVRDAVHLEGDVWLSDRIDTPFLLGYIKPRIYMPFFVDESRREYIVAHEKGHIKRGDHITKLIGYILLSVYWFQPLVWVAYVLFCKDVEMACDELVIGNLGEEKKKAYSQTLLLCSVEKHYLLANPLAFGEIDVKKRITNVLSYKKPGVIISVISVIILVLAAVFFMTSGKEEKMPGATELSQYQIEFLETLGSGTRYAVVPLSGASEPMLLTTNDNWEQPEFENETDSIHMNYCIFNQLGKIGTTGSAYPLRADEDALYLMDDIQLTMITVSEEISPITGLPYLSWVSYAEGDGEYSKILKKYEAASFVEFDNVVDNTPAENEVLTEEQWTYLKSRDAGEQLALIPLEGATEPLLLVTTGVYEDPAFDNAEVSFAADYCMYGQVGQINGGGTAYPIRADQNAVYMESGHSISILRISEEMNPETGLPILETITYSENDDSYQEMMDRCHAAPVVDFEVVMVNLDVEEQIIEVSGLVEMTEEEIAQLQSQLASSEEEKKALQEMEASLVPSWKN